MSREWLEKVSHYRESHSVFRIVTLRQVQTGQFSSSADYLLCTSACFVPWPYYLSFLCHCLFCIVTSLWTGYKSLNPSPPLVCGNRTLLCVGNPQFMYKGRSCQRLVFTLRCHGLHHWLERLELAEILLPLLRP